MRLKVRQVIDIVANRFGTSREAMLGPRCNLETSHARMVAYWLATELIQDQTIQQIARTFNRDRSTVIHGVKRIRALAHLDQALIDSTKLCIADIWELAK